jgi:hypothetical protein
VVFLVGWISLLDSDVALFGLVDTEGVTVQQVDGGEDRFPLEVDDQGIAVEVTLFVGVHLDTLFAVCALVNDAVSGEYLIEVVLVGVGRQVGNPDGAVLLNDLGLLGNLCDMLARRN